MGLASFAVFYSILGFVLYLILGQNFRKDRMFKMKEIEGEIKYAVRRQEESIYRKRLRLRDPELDRFKSLILYNLNEGEAVLTDNNDVRIYTDGREKFDALLNEMDHARNYIHIQYYIMRNDELWKEIEEVLLRKARQGVEIRVLFDSMGCRGERACTGRTGNGLPGPASRWQSFSRQCLVNCSCG